MEPTVPSSVAADDYARSFSTLPFLWTPRGNARYNCRMETKYVPAIFESGKLRPLMPLDLHQQERVELAVIRSPFADEDSDEGYVPLIAAEADATVTLEQVQQLAKIPGSLAEDFAHEARRPLLMPPYFLDSCALAKAYHVETGTPKMLAMLADAASHFFISSLTVIEIQSVFGQKVRDGKIDETDYRLVKKRFAADIDAKRLIVKNLLRPHQRMAERLLEIHAKVRRLRTLDVLQLGRGAGIMGRASLGSFYFLR